LFIPAKGDTEIDPVAPSDVQAGSWYQPKVIAFTLELVRVAVPPKQKVVSAPAFAITVVITPIDMEYVAVQALASVIVTEYIPAQSPDTSCVVCPPGTHVYEYGVVPPVGVMSINPLQVLLQLAFVLTKVEVNIAGFVRCCAARRCCRNNSITCVVAKWVCSGNI